MNKKFSKLQAFTLIEVLISSAIFAVIMVIAAGTVSRTISYHGKLESSRDVTGEMSRLADLITRDVREAKGGATVSLGAGKIFDSGIILFNCASPTCAVVDDDSADAAAANTLVLFNKDSYKIYTSQGSPASVYFKSVNGSPGDLTGISTIVLDSVNGMIKSSPITNIDYSTPVSFNGFAPDVDHATVQPFVRFTIASETANYNDAPATERARATIRSVAASRHYRK